MQGIIQTMSSPDLWPTVSSISVAVVVLGLLIFAHELGHFIVAKLSGVGVLKFSLGFGKKVIGRKIGETEYMVSIFPLGGYVKMLGEDEESGDLTPEEKKRSFTEQPVWKRAAIVFAGPLFNIFLAIFLCYLLFLTGFPAAIAKVSDVVPGSPAEKAGFRPGDIVQKVDDEYVDVWEQVPEYVKENPGREIAFTVLRDGSQATLKATPEEIDGGRDIGLIGYVTIGAVMSGSPADLAGIQAKDHVVAVDGVKVGSWKEMSDAVKKSPGQEMVFTVERGGSVADLKVTPKPGEGDAEKHGVIGVLMGTEAQKVAYGPVESLGLSLDRTYYMTRLTVTFLARLIGGKEDASQIGGPVAIVQLSGRQARQGLADLVIFIALLSVNLGVINLFPIPILDGGHLMFLGIEAAMGKPLGMRKREIAQQIGLFMLIALMVFVFYNDIMRLLGFSAMWK